VRADPIPTPEERETASRVVAEQPPFRALVCAQALARARVEAQRPLIELLRDLRPIVEAAEAQAKSVAPFLRLNGDESTAAAGPVTPEEARAANAAADDYGDCCVATEEAVDAQPGVLARLDELLAKEVSRG
jgi:hypothetical protein